VERAGRRGLAVPTNLAREDEVVRMVEQTAAHFGRLDVLVNNAAITFVGDLDIPLKRHDLIMEVNVRAPFIAMREAVPHLRAAGGGAILNLSSVAALLPVPGLMSYGVSKVALERMSVDVANQLHGDGIAVSVFRIDCSVASEGFVANTPGIDRSTWEPCEVAAEGVLWTLRQGLAVSGQLLSMLELREKHGIMASRAEKPGPSRAPRQMVTGIVPRGDLVFEDA
jgi:citronellol/citronellal dehydrogenase